MLVIHADTYMENVIIPKVEWAVILDKLRIYDDIKIEEVKKEKINKIKGKGIFKKYAKPDLIEKEKEVWAEAAVEKHENR